MEIKCGNSNYYKINYFLEILYALSYLKSFKGPYLYVPILLKNLVSFIVHAN